MVEMVEDDIPTKVRKALEGNPNVIIIEERKLTDVQLRPGFWNEMFIFTIVPKQGLYTIEKLQEFMMNLIPDDVKLSEKNNFEITGKKISFGSLHFYEVIGEVIGENKKRETFIKIYPDSEIAEKKQENKDSISSFEMSKYELIMRRLFVWFSYK